MYFLLLQVISKNYKSHYTGGKKVELINFIKLYQLFVVTW